MGDHYKEGFFGSPHVTTWKRGVPAAVYWTSHAHHRGGYAFRLCKVENGEVWNVTEECFNNGHLNFSGNTSWVYREPNNEDYNEDGWKPQESVRTTTGTTPHGSEWTKINLPKTHKKLCGLLGIWLRFQNHLKQESMFCHSDGIVNKVHKCGMHVQTFMLSNLKHAVKNIQRYNPFVLI